MNRDPLLELWKAFCRAETDLRRTSIASQIEQLLKRHQTRESEDVRKAA